MSKPIIFMDLDGCIYSFLDAFWDELVWHHNYPADQYNDYMNNPDKYIDTPLGRQLLKVPVIFERIKAKPRDIQTLNKLSEIYDVWYVTGRHDCVHLATKHWLTREKFPEGKIVHTNEKGELAKEVKPLFAVEDQEKHILSMQPYTTVFIVNHNYNEHIETKTRINHVSELVLD